MLAKLLATFLLGLATSALSIVILRNFALQRKAQRVPVIGGIAIWASLTIVCAVIFYIYPYHSWELSGILVASFLMLVFGVIDDWRELSIASKFIVQTIATIVLIFFGVKTQIVFVSPLLNIIITFIWVIGITNAFNHIDIMDGLAAGAAIIISVSFFCVASFFKMAWIQFVTIALTGSLCSFLIFNLSSAKVYMGNAGSHYLGFLLAALALSVHYASVERPIALISPLLILGFLIFDTTFLVAMRLAKKKIPFKKSNDHLALRLLANGYSKKKALGLLLSVCLFFALSGIYITQVDAAAGFGILIVLLCASVLLMQKMSRIEVDE